jgi:two-component SAPR family response regulator
VITTVTRRNEPYTPVIMRKVILSISALKAMNFLLETVLAPTHTIIPVSDAVNGMNIMRLKTKVDVIIVDVDYNTEENREFIFHVKSSRFYSNCRVIVLKSSGTNSLTELELSKVDHVFEKPFSPQVLVDIVENISSAKEVYQIDN